MLAVPEGNVQGTLSWNGTPLDPQDLAVLSPAMLDLFHLVPLAGSGYFAHGVPAGNHILDVGGTGVARASFAVTAGQTTTADLDLTSTFGRAAGTLVVNGAPAVNMALGFDATPPPYGYRVSTDGSGQFSTLLLPGSHFLYWARGTDGVTHSCSTAFSVAAGQTTSLGTIALDDGGVQGTILFNGAPIGNLEAAGLQLSVEGPSSPGTLPALTSASYAIAGLSPGPTTVFVSGVGGAIGFVSVTVVAGSVATADIDVTPGAGRVSGNVAPGDAPVPPTGLPILMSGGPSATTDASGNFSWLLSPGNYSPIVSVPETGVFGPLPDVFVQAGVDMNVGAIQLADVGGKLLWNGRALSADEASAAYWASETVDSSSYVALQFSDGSYSAHLTLGDHPLQIYVGDLGATEGPIGCNPIEIPVATATLTAIAGATTTADIDLAAIAGRVTGTLTTNGTSLSSATISISVDNNFPEEAPSPCTVTATYTAGPTGDFSIFLPPGNYTAQITDSTGAFVGTIPMVADAGQTTFLDGPPPPGTPCSGVSDCADGAFCVDGVCCTSACGGGNPNDCQACAVAAGGTTDGTCTPLTTPQTCRPSDGVCDVAETCSPSSLDCPSDSFAASSQVCRAAAGTCDVPELCTGSSATCPADAFVASGTVCGAPPTDLCQSAGVCSGTGAVCQGPTTLPTNVCMSVPQTTNPNTPLNFLGGDGVVGGVSITFGGPFTSNVEIEVLASDVGPPPPPGYKIVTNGKAQYLNIDASPNTAYTAPSICVGVPPGMACGLTLLHDAGSGFQDITATNKNCDANSELCTSGQPCPVPNVVCGIATVHFSPFAIAQPTSAPPAVTVPANITAEATGPKGAQVTYLASASDAQGGSLTPKCTPASGATFPLGATTVTCTAVDQQGLSASKSFTVTVRDTTGPVFSNVPGPVTAFATSTGGAKVSYTLPKATDAVDGSRPLTCTPASGGLFPVGRTQVSCKAGDTRGNSSTATFTVSVTYQAPTDGTFFLFPIQSNGGSIFPIGPLPLPVRFRLTGASAGITNLVAKFSVTKTSSSILGSVNEVSDETVSDTGLTFIYRPLLQWYAYRWKVSDQTQGTYQIKADLGDGVVHQINVSLKTVKQ
jgi:hypothetical protein